jgi:hypothetical protein
MVEHHGVGAADYNNIISASVDICAGVNAFDLVPLNVCHVEILRPRLFL